MNSCEMRTTNVGRIGFVSTELVLARETLPSSVRCPNADPGRPRLAEQRAPRLACGATMCGRPIGAVSHRWGLSAISPSSVFGNPECNVCRHRLGLEPIPIVDEEAPGRGAVFRADLRLPRTLPGSPAPEQL